MNANTRKFNHIKQIACSLLLMAAFRSQGQQVVVTPQNPEPGQVITVQFTPAASAGSAVNESISAKDTGLALVFTFSNLFDMPNRLPMRRNGNQWEVSFRLARYATHATFTIQSGTKVQQPSKEWHYAIPVYQNRKRIKSGYLYEGYAVATQLGKDPRVPELQLKLLEKELELHPDNYEARVRLLQNKMTSATGKEKEKYRKQALEVIAANFYRDPGNSGLMNKTTMGYLIIGENSRVDSIRKVIRDKYPNTEAGYSMQVSEIEDIGDREERRRAAEALLQKVPASQAHYVNDLHGILLTYYIETKNAAKALHHLAKIETDTTPYRGPALLNRARLFWENDMLLDSAIAFTDRAFAIAPHFPAGLIRFFPETGYILPYVEPAARVQIEQAARGSSLSLKALILQKKGLHLDAGETLVRALTYSDDDKTLANAGLYYRGEHNYAQAFQVTKKLVMNFREDTAAQRHLKEDYAQWKPDLAGWDDEMKQVTDHWRKNILVTLKKERINKKMPVMEKLVTLEGKPVPPSALEGKILIVDFWATWCVPCMKQMPYMQAVYNKYKDNPKVMFMIVNTGSKNTLADARNWSGNKTWSFPVYYTNEESLGERFGFRVIPATVVVAPSGNIQWRSIGFEGPSIEHKLSTAIDLLLSGE